jgi:meiotic recombination protein SPO11
MSRVIERDSSTKGKKKRKETITEDLVVPGVDEVLAAVRQTRKALFTLLSGTEDAPMLSNLAGVTEVEDLTTDQVSEKIEDLVVNVVTQIVTNGSFELLIPNRSSSNQRYIEELDRTVLGDKMSKRAFLNTSHVRKAAITTKVVELVHEVLSKGIHITKRDLFYTDVKLFKDQTESDAVLDDVACMVGCTRTSLHVVASDKGLVVGRIQYREAGDYIDCTKMGIGGKAIPPYVDKITDITSDADFIILVEKEAAYMRLAEDRFYNKYPCIVITGKGQPDVATRLFLRKIRFVPSSNKIKFYFHPNFCIIPHVYSRC